MHASTICMLNMFSTVVQPKTIDFPISEKNGKNIGYSFLSKVQFTSLHNVSSCRNYAIIKNILQLIHSEPLFKIVIIQEFVHIVYDYL